MRIVVGNTYMNNVKQRGCASTHACASSTTFEPLLVLPFFLQIPAEMDDLLPIQRALS